MIADLNLGGGQSGTELSVRLNTTRPKLKYLFISGYPVEGWSERDKENVARLPAMVYSVLAKPFSAGVLVNAIKNLTARGKKIGLNPHLKEMLCVMVGWLNSNSEAESEWNLYILTARLCLGELISLAAADEDHDDLNQAVVPHFKAAVIALETKQRQSASEALKTVLASLEDTTYPEGTFRPGNQLVTVPGN